MATAAKKTKKAKKMAGKKKRWWWSSGTFRTCSACHSEGHNVRTCSMLKKATKKKAKKK